MKNALDRKLLEGIEDYDSFFALSHEFSGYPEDELFNFLFSTAIGERGGNINGVAGMLLIDLEPKHTRSCSELLNEIAHSNWDVSNKEIPFYMVSQFGKWNLASEIKEYVANTKLNDIEQRRVETIWYWASSPSSKLSNDLHYFEWQEAIEGEDSNA
jgi:hypothetical protein